MKRKDIHLRLDYSISDRVEEIIKNSRRSVSDVYSDIILLGLNYSRIIDEISKVLKEVNYSNRLNNYLVKLSEQIYSDLNLEQLDPKQSVNLAEFKKNYRKGDNNLID